MAPPPPSVRGEGVGTHQSPANNWFVLKSYIETGNRCLIMNLPASYGARE